jgi:phosphoribosylaminoimidazole-succinocarboxamide synthase
VYTISNDILVIVACDRISAFDHVLPKSIPNKGQVLTEIANQFLDSTSHIIPNWKISNPDPQVTIGKRCDAMECAVMYSARLILLSSYPARTGILKLFILQGVQS